MMLKFILVWSLLALPGFASKLINVINNCPISIDIFPNLVFNSAVPSNSVLPLTLDDDFGGQIYADANGGTYVGFVLPVCSSFRSSICLIYLQWDYYYIVRRLSFYNLGVSITPADERSVRAILHQLTCRISQKGIGQWILRDRHLR